MLAMLLYFGWFLEVPLSLKKKCVVGDFVEILCSVYAIALRKMLSICSSNLVSAVEYGGMYDKT